MSVAAPKSQAKEPIQLDIIIVCRKDVLEKNKSTPQIYDAINSAKTKVTRLKKHLDLSRNDKKIVLFGQALTSLKTITDIKNLSSIIEQELKNI